MRALEGKAKNGLAIVPPALRAVAAGAYGTATGVDAMVRAIGNSRWPDRLRPQQGRCP